MASFLPLPNYYLTKTSILQWNHKMEASSFVEVRFVIYDNGMKLYFCNFIIYKKKTVKICRSKLGNKKWLNSRFHHQRPISDSWKSEELKKNLPTHSKTKQLVHYFLLLLLSSSLVLNERKSYSQWNKSSMLWPD